MSIGTVVMKLSSNGVMHQWTGPMCELSENHKMEELQDL